MDKFALLVRMNPKYWPAWERKIAPGQESNVWFEIGRRIPEEIHAGLPVVMLGTSGMGILATGETASAAEFRADPDWAEADPSEQDECKQPRNRVCIRLKGLAAVVPIEEVEEGPDTARLPKAARETITTCSTHVSRAAAQRLTRRRSRTRARRQCFASAGTARRSTLDEYSQFLMLLEFDKFRPVRGGGIILIGIGLAGFWFHSEHLTDPQFSWFIFGATIWHLTTGLGVILQRTWGYYLLKFYLYVLLLAIPIGTYIAWKSLMYLRENEIENFFGRKALQL